MTYFIFRAIYLVNVLQVDAQGSEVRIFDPKTASRFLDEVDVAIIQIEWNMIAHQNKVDSQRQASVDHMLNMFYERNYTVHGMDKEMKVIHDRDWRQWPDDIILFREARCV